MKTNQDILIQEIIDLRLKQGYSTPNIIDYIKETYGYKQSRAYELWRIARAKIGEIYQKMNTDALVDSVLLMENMIQTALADDNSKLALDVLKELNKCNQLHIKKLELDTKGEPIIINLK